MKSKCEICGAPAKVHVSIPVNTTTYFCPQHHPMTAYHKGYREGLEKAERIQKIGFGATGKCLIRKKDIDSVEALERGRGA